MSLPALLLVGTLAFVWIASAIAVFAALAVQVWRDPLRRRQPSRTSTTWIDAREPAVTDFDALHSHAG